MQPSRDAPSGARTRCDGSMSTSCPCRSGPGQVPGVQGLSEADHAASYGDRLSEGGADDVLLRESLPCQLFVDPAVVHDDHAVADMNELIRGRRIVQDAVALARELPDEVENLGFRS